MNTTSANEMERLKAAELAAERRYFQAMERADMPAARVAADLWLKASDAYTDYLVKQRGLHRANG